MKILLNMSMVSYFFHQIDLAPALILIISAIGVHILNAGIGIVLAFRQRCYIRKLHKLVYFSLLLLLMTFFVRNFLRGVTGFMEYVILAYYMVLIPISKNWDVSVHALVATVGLTLLPLIILLNNSEVTP